MDAKLPPRNYIISRTTPWLTLWIHVKRSIIVVNRPFTFLQGLPSLQPLADTAIFVCENTWVSHSFFSWVWYRYRLYKKAPGARWGDGPCLCGVTFGSFIFWLSELSIWVGGRFAWGRINRINSRVNCFFRHHCPSRWRQSILITKSSLIWRI